MSARTLLERLFRQAAAIVLPVAFIVVLGHFLGSPDFLYGTWGRFESDRIIYVLSSAAFGVFVGAIAAHTAFPFSVQVPAYLVAAGIFFIMAPQTVGEWLLGRPGRLTEWTIGLVLPPAYLLGAFWIHGRLRKTELKREYEEKAAHKAWQEKVAKMQERDAGGDEGR